MLITNSYHSDAYACTCTKKLLATEVLIGGYEFKVLY